MYISLYDLSLHLRKKYNNANNHFDLTLYRYCFCFQRFSIFVFFIYLITDSTHVKSTHTLVKYAYLWIHIVKWTSTDRTMLTNIKVSTPLCVCTSFFRSHVTRKSFLFRFYLTDFLILFDFDNSITLGWMNAIWVHDNVVGIISSFVCQFYCNGEPKMKMFIRHNRDFIWSAVRWVYKAEITEINSFRYLEWKWIWLVRRYSRKEFWCYCWNHDRAVAR